MVPILSAVLSGGKDLTLVPVASHMADGPAPALLAVTSPRQAESIVGALPGHLLVSGNRRRNRGGWRVRLDGWLVGEEWRNSHHLCGTALADTPPLMVC